MAFDRCRNCSFVKSYFLVILVAAFTMRFLPQYSVLINSLFLIGIPVLVYRKDAYELGFRNYLSGLKWGLSVSAFVLGCYFLFCSRLGESLNLNFSFGTALFFLSVALGEELFFRGFFYSLFENEEIIGGLLTKNNLISSVLFGIAHALIYYDPSMFKVFFPSLVMGWLYERSGSLVAPVIFHWLSDIIYQFVRCV
ncbi:CPBP family glutamic-type intramembrane protease [Thermovibrio sp.]